MTMGERGSGSIVMRGAVLLVPLLMLLAVICIGDDSEPAGDESSMAEVSAAPILESIESLREIDFTAAALVGPLIDAAGGGEVVPERVEFADLVGDDGVEEAFVIVESGGTLGDLGVGVFVIEGGQAVLRQFIQTAGRVELRLDLVVILEGVWADDDPQCCPAELLERSYQWDGARFTVITEQVVSNSAQ
jgi:hypothetical protein